MFQDVKKMMVLLSQVSGAKLLRKKTTQTQHRTELRDSLKNKKSMSSKEFFTHK